MTDLSHLSDEAREKVERWNFLNSSFLDPDASHSDAMRMLDAAELSIAALLAEVERWKWVAKQSVADHCETAGDPRGADGVDDCPSCSNSLAALLARYDAEVKP